MSCCNKTQMGLFEGGVHKVTVALGVHEGFTAGTRVAFRICPARCYHVDRQDMLRATKVLLPLFSVRRLSVQKSSAAACVCTLEGDGGQAGTQ